MTDSEQVPWGKGEKIFERRSAIYDETGSWQSVGACVTACLLKNEPATYKKWLG